MTAWIRKIPKSNFPLQYQAQPNRGIELKAAHSTNIRSETQRSNRGKFDTNYFVSYTICYKSNYSVIENKTKKPNPNMHHSPVSLSASFQLSSIILSCSDLFTSFPHHFDPHGSRLIGANSQVLFFRSNLPVSGIHKHTLYENNLIHVGEFSTYSLGSRTHAPKLSIPSTSFPFSTRILPSSLPSLPYESRRHGGPIQHRNNCNER